MKKILLVGLLLASLNSFGFGFGNCTAEYFYGGKWIKVYVEELPSGQYKINSPEVYTVVRKHELRNLSCM